MVFLHQGTLSSGLEAVQGGSKGLHRSPQAGWEECKGVLQTGSSLQGAQGKDPHRDTRPSQSFLRALALGLASEAAPLYSFSQALGKPRSLCRQLSPTLTLVASRSPPQLFFFFSRTINLALRILAASYKLNPEMALHRSYGRKLTRT